MRCPASPSKIPESLALIQPFVVPNPRPPQFCLCVTGTPLGRFLTLPSTLLRTLVWLGREGLLGRNEGRATPRACRRSSPSLIQKRTQAGRCVVAQREMEKRRSPLVYRFRPDGRGFSRHLGVYRPMTRCGQCTARGGKLSRCWASAR